MSITAGMPIYYGYNGSPFVAKLETILLLKNIPARRVDVALYPPRPELATLLGLPYRRVPVLALGRDIYADTSLIASVLERRFPASSGHPSIFPPRKGTRGSTDIGVQKALAQFYADKQLFQVGFGLLPWTKLPSEVQADRKKFIDQDVDFVELAKQRTVNQSKLVSHLALYEEQLVDGREWFLDTEVPGLVDVSVYFILSWCRSFRDTRPVFDAAQFPRTITWLNRMEGLLKQRREASPAPLTKVSGADAAKEILSSHFLDISGVGFDEVEATRLGIKLGGHVAVRPDDTGKEVETLGKVVALNREEIVIETQAQEGGPEAIRVHFPRLGYVLRDASAVTSRL